MNASPRFVIGALVTLAALRSLVSAQTRPAEPVPALGANRNQDEAVVLSPFEVISDSKGCFSPNTMATHNDEHLGMTAHLLCPLL